jgi:rod shape-determining protein MreC
VKYLIISFLILIVGFFGILNPLRGGFHFIFAPIQFGFTRMADDIRDLSSFFLNISSVHDQNLKLQSDNETLRSAIVDLKKFEDENKVLKDQLGLKSTGASQRNLLLANVMGNSDDLSGSSLIIDKGSRQGLVVGVNVIKGNYLVGSIKEVFNDRSVVELITSPSVSIAVYDLDVPGRTEGLAVGQYGTSIEMRRILPNEDIKIGDTILTSGKEGIYEPGLIVGKVKEIKQVPVEPLKSAFLETVIELGNIDKVFVLLRT